MSRVTPRPVEPKPVKADKPKRKGMRQVSAKRMALKSSAIGIDGKAHMALVAQLPCCICQAFGMAQTSPTQVHHVISGRYGTMRAIDRATIPLCEGHHLGLLDTSKTAIHQGKETWEAAFGKDYEYIAPTLDAVELLAA